MYVNSLLYLSIHGEQELFVGKGGRFTINSVHYVLQGEELVPAALTEFARDKSFGYRSSSLPEYVEEKNEGAYKAADVIAITLDSLRSLDYDGITKQLLAVREFNKVVVNAVDYCDIKVFSTALYRAMAQGKTRHRRALDFPGRMCYNRQRIQEGGAA